MLRDIMFKRMTSLVLCFVMMMPAILALPADVDAATDADDTVTVKSAEQMYNKYHETSYYSDELFTGDSYDYNAKLATLSYSVCNMSYFWKNAKSPEENPLCLKAYLEDKGFCDFDVNEDYIKPVEEDSSPVACAHKKIADRGREYTLLAVIPRSGTFDAEYLRNMTQGDRENDTGDFAGYRESCAKMVEFVHGYVKKYGIKGDVKVWTTGYSGGAGTDMLFSAGLLRDAASILGEDVKMDPSDLYCYNFSPMRVASVSGDCKDKKYGCMHNVFDPADILTNIPINAFDLYGTDYYLPEHGDKTRMLELLELQDPEEYKAYLEKDPDGFTPYMLDMKALLRGKLSMIPDSDSYLPKEQRAYLISVISNLEAFLARSGDGNSREGYYRVYQEPAKHMIHYIVHEGIYNLKMDVLMNAFTGTKTSVPMLLSMYTTFVLDRSLYSSSDDTDLMIEDSFNKLADLIEGGDGKLLSIYGKLPVYIALREAFFEKDTESDGGRYVLRHPTDRVERSILLKNMKKLTARLYSESLKTALKEDGTEQKWTDLLTGEEDSSAMSMLFAVMLFGNSAQSSRFDPTSAVNEPLNQMATFINNFDRFIAPHFFNNVISWLRSGDPYYADYTPATEAQKSGYRRVYIEAADGVSVSGTVSDMAGNKLAEFADGRIVYRSDDWIGYTSGDNSGWLRLPLDESFKVRIDPGSASVNVRVAEYSGYDLREVRKVKFTARKGGGVLSLPAAEPEDGKYMLPTDLKYSMKITEKVSSSVPKVKSFSVKSGKKSLTAKWKKLSASQLGKVSNIEVCCSTSRSFKKSCTTTYELAENKSSLKISRLRKGRTYYLRARNIRYKNGTKYVSGWSSVKKLKVR